MEKEFRGSIVEPGLDSKSPDSNHRYFPQEMVEEDTILLLRRMVLWTWFGFSGIKTALSRHSQVYLGLWGVKGNLDKNIRVIYQLSSLLSLFSSGLRETNQEPRSPTKLINHSVHPCPPTHTEELESLKGSLLLFREQPARKYGHSRCMPFKKENCFAINRSNDYQGKNHEIADWK